MKHTDELIFWFDQPPKVSLGAFNYVVEQWGCNVIYVIDHQLGAHRKLIGWDETSFPGVNIVMLDEQGNQTKCIEQIFQLHPNAIHIVNGFFSNIERKIRKYILHRGLKLGFMSERPTILKYDSSIKQMIKNHLLPFKYKLAYRRYKSDVRFVLPLGLEGKHEFESFGWPKDKLYNFMYCPVLAELCTQTSNQHIEGIRFLYVGRFVKKRLATVMESVERLKGEKWSLELVGGYGADAKEIINWCNRTKNVSFGGTWPADEVGKKMQDYDVYLLATQYDGWNAQINEAIHAGLGVITTDEAVSDELISASGSGIVVQAKDDNAFYQAMQNVVEHPEIVLTWKIKAKEYRKKIHGNTVGQYLIDILDYTFYDKKNKPQCPWL